MLRKIWLVIGAAINPGFIQVCDKTMGRSTRFVTLSLAVLVMTACPDRDDPNPNPFPTGPTGPSVPSTVIVSISGAGSGNGRVTSFPAGIDCTIASGASSGACTLTVAMNVSLSLTATSGSNSTFQTWSGACTGSSTCSVLMSQAQSVTATFMAAVAAGVATVGVSPPSNTLQVGGVTQLTATARDANGNVIAGKVAVWTSTDNSVAEVNQSGVVTAKVVGSAVITATVDGRTGSSTVQVTPPPTVTFQSPETLFLEDDGTLNGLGAYKYQGFTLSGTRTFVFRVVGNFALDAAIITPGELGNFTGNRTFTGFALFDNQYGTKSVTLGAGTYYVAVRNQVSGANTYRFELDYDIQLSSEQGYSFSFVDVYVQSTSSVGANGGKLWQPFTVQNGFRYLLDGASLGVETFIIRASELSKFQANQSFQYFTDYGGSSATANPGLWEIRLPAGDYYLVFRNNIGAAGQVTYTMERWRIN